MPYSLEQLSSNGNTLGGSVTGGPLTDVVVAWPPTHSTPGSIRWTGPHPKDESHPKGVI
ncbi:hypothetical protein GCM10010176_071810 [Nonomuraea spiralis]|nr:hypothetical protein GCM10010176_071810 [Nonomuraea spiralis]